MAIARARSNVPWQLGKIPMDGVSPVPGHLAARFLSQQQLLIEALRRAPKRSRQSILIEDDLRALVRARLERESRCVQSAPPQQEDEGAPLKWWQL